MLLWFFGFFLNIAIGPIHKVLRKKACKVIFLQKNGSRKVKVLRCSQYWTYTKLTAIELLKKVINTSQ